MEWQTVAIPFAAGIKPTSRGRVLDSSKLLTAQNCFFYLDEGPQKRFGHHSRAIKTPDAPIGLDGIIPPVAPPLRTPFSLERPNLSEYWVHGYGLTGSDPIAYTGTPGLFAHSPQPSVGTVYGVWKRDDEVVFWDGMRALGKPGNAVSPFAEVTGEAVFPALRGEPIAKSPFGQLSPDAVDNGVLRTVVWTDANGVHRSVFYSATGAAVINEELLHADVSTTRCVSTGAWTHVVYHDPDLNEITLKSWHQDTPQTVLSRSLGPTDLERFDVKKIDETSFVVAKLMDDDIDIVVCDLTSTIAAYTIEPALVDEIVSAIHVTIAPTHRGELGVMWQTDAFDVNFRTYTTESGVPTRDRLTVDGSPSALARLTLIDNYNDSRGTSAWLAYVNDAASTRLFGIGSAVTPRAVRFQVHLASHAFRVGQRGYVWATLSSTYALQPTWFLCDEEMLPVGKMLFGLAYPQASDVYTLPSTTWHTSDANHEPKDRFVFFGALGYRQRANTDTQAGDPNGVFLEPSIFFYTLDFLPYLRSAQAGRSTYIAGAQLWEYDGANLNEAGFHTAPEGVVVGDGGAGNLDETKAYGWRVDLCYKNAQNEEVRSWSNIVTTDASEFGGATFKATLTIPHVPMTRRDDSYFLVFRTEGNGTEFYLVSSRDPSVTGENGYIANSRGAATYTFTDNLSDALLIAREYHPANAPTYVQPLPAPACELVAAGRDRLWLAGGELSPGEVAPSRYFRPGETPSFSPALNIQIDRNSEPITAIGFVGENAVFFRKTSAYTLDSDGPDNVLQGVWGFPRLALADVGAVSQEGLALAGEGLYFQSTAGIRVITQGGGLRPPGAGLIGGLGTDVDTLTGSGEYAAAVVVPKYSQIRWYSRDPEKPTMVVDYTKNTWTTFTGLECRGAVYWAPGDTVLLARGDAEVWTEVEGRYLDGDRTYETLLRTAWLHGGNMGDFHRARRWALSGDADTGLSLRYRVFYDERPFHAEEGFVEFNGNSNDSVWGDNEWGDGSWGDSNNPDGQSGLWFRDGVFRLRRRFARQKCSVFSVEFSDQSGTASFAPTVLALELGLKQGLDRIS